MFVPVTNVTLATAANQYYGARPFIAVNKKHITWLQASIIS
jgi:hypothetical protein